MVQFRVDLLFLPEEGLQVLHPFEVGHDHAAGVGEDVWHHENAALVEDRVGFRRDGGVGAFGDQPGSNAPRVVASDLVLHGRRHQHRHRQLEQLGVGHRVGLLEPADAAPNLAVLFERGEVQAVGVVDAAPGVADRDDAQAGLREQPGRRTANLAVTLDRDGRRLFVDVQVLERLECQVRRAATGRLDAAFGTAYVDRLAGHRRGDRVALVHGDGVHDPGHDLWIGAHVWRRDVLLGADQDRDLGRIPPRQVLQLVG